MVYTNIIHVDLRLGWSLDFLEWKLDSELYRDLSLYEDLGVLCVI